MFKLRSSWRPILFWALVFAGILFFAFGDPRVKSLFPQARDLYTLLSTGDLARFTDFKLLKTVGLSLVLFSFFLSLFFFLLTRLIRAIYALFAYRYRVTTDKIIAVHGLFGRDYREGRRPDFRNVRIKQGLLDRLLGVGDITLSTVGEKGLEIHFKKISAPLKIKDKILNIAVFTPPTAEPSPAKAKSAAPESQDLPDLSELTTPSFLEARLLAEEAAEEEHTEDSLTQIDPNAVK